MKTKIRTIALLMGLVGTGCGGGGGGGDPPPASSGNLKHVLLIYMIGSDLESAGNNGTIDLAEMVASGTNSDIAVIVQTGGANKPGWRTNKRLRIGTGSITELADLGAINMADPTTLREFVSFGLAAFPADNYSLVLWDHGGGAVGQTFGNDENFGNDALSLNELQSALQQSVGTAGKKFEILGFDACLMATIETASMLASFADFLVASEELEPGTGWNYTAILNSLKASPTQAGSQLGRVIADSYQASVPDNDTITLSVTDLSRIPALVSALESLTDAIVADFSTMAMNAAQRLAAARFPSESYGRGTPANPGTDMVDLGTLADALASSYPQQTAALNAALGQAVPYRVNGAARPSSSGLSVYVPAEQFQQSSLLIAKLNQYGSLNFSQKYRNLVSQYAQNLQTDVTAPVVTNETYNASTGAYTAEIPSVDTENVIAVVSYSDADTGSVTLVSGDFSVVNVGARTAEYDFAPIGLALNNSVYIMPLPLEQANNLELYGAPMYINGVSAFCLIVVDLSVGSIEIAGAIPESAGDTVSRVVPIEPGDQIVPVFLSFNVQTEQYTETVGTQFTVPAEGAQLTFNTLPTGSYFVGLIATDYSGNDGEGNFFIMNAP